MTDFDDSFPPIEDVPIDTEWWFLGVAGAAVFACAALVVLLA